MVRLRLFLALVVAGLLPWAVAGQPTRFDTLRFALITDTHIGKPGNDTGLSTIVADINRNPHLSFVVVTGDVTDFGTTPQLQQAKQLLDQLNKPYYCLPGNHDTGWSESGGLQFSKLWRDQKFVADIQGVRCVGVSTGPYGRMSRGYVPQEQLRWLDSLARATPATQPVLFFTHYPLNDQLSNSAAVISALHRFRTQSVFCGHGHVNQVFNFGGLPGIMTRTAQRREGTVAYTTVTVSADSVALRMVRPGQPATAPWARLAAGRPPVVDTLVAKTLPTATPYPAGQVVWQQQGRGNIVATPALWRHTALVGDLLGEFQALALRDGRVKWTFRSRQPLYSSPAVAGRRVVFGSADSSIYCLHTRTGRVLWQVKTGGPVLASPLIERGVVYIGSSDRTFRALDLATGRVRWAYTHLAGFPPGTPTLAEGKVVFGTWGQTLYALNAADGTLAWQWRNDQRSVYYSPAMCTPVVQHGVVYVVAPDEKLHGLALHTGQPVVEDQRWRVRESLGGDLSGKILLSKTMRDSVVAWQTRPGQLPQPYLQLDAGFGEDFSASMPVFMGKLAFFGTTFGKVYAVDLPTQRVRWVYALGSDMVNTPRVLGRRGVLVSSSDGKMALLASGKRK
ncbi:PQQ-binding-like beta-propeller repeat protein [Hymenobacter sp. YC55]|uniref:outer membrane protein assembly factor BamB family protein n=1 Tax=Hymenobacter sp. YC55 TaxID=3034019 RepID=UPI0023F88ADE|nr:PQQ-binding-like beta-propeller repeat protein [Hymenobacter sp. YC55]MDF7813972.1 PQQ-binding-like beta-propeller repeat protein [Hymenobacter sp. YC55]